MDIQKLLQQAQQMQSDLSKTEEELSQTVYKGEAGGKDGVIIKINGANEVQEVIISDSLMAMNDKEMLQDLILIAMNNAVEIAAEDRDSRLGSITQGIKIPGM